MEEGKCSIVLRLGLSLLVSLCLCIVNFTCASQSLHLYPEMEQDDRRAVEWGHWRSDPDLVISLSQAS